MPDNLCCSELEVNKYVKNMMEFQSAKFSHSGHMTGTPVFDSGTIYDKKNPIGLYGSVNMVSIFSRKHKLKACHESLTHERFTLAEITDGHIYTVGRIDTYTMEDGYQQFLKIVAENRWQLVKFEAMPSRMRANVLIEGENKKHYERWGGLARYVLMPSRELQRADEPFVGPAFEEWPASDSKVGTDWYKG